RDFDAAFQIGALFGTKPESDKAGPAVNVVWGSCGFRHRDEIWTIARFYLRHIAKANAKNVRWLYLYLIRFEQVWDHARVVAMNEGQFELLTIKGAYNRAEP